MTLNNCPNWGDSIPDPSRDQVAASYRNAIATAQSKTIELDDVKNWHKSLFEEVVPVSYYAGNFRQDDLQRPCLGVDVRVGAHPGISFRHVVGHLEILFSQIRTSISKMELSWATLSPVDRAFQIAVIICELIGKFIQIHPFINGNGRLSRLIWAVALVRFGVSPQYRIHPRPFQPYGRIMESCMQGDFRPVQLCVLQHLSLKRPRQVQPAS